MLIVDTLPQFAGLEGDQESNAGDALHAVKPLQFAAAEGLAVAFSHHERKSGGRVGESGRGSCAFAGAVDLVLSLRRPEGNHRETVREIQAVSQFEETPARLMIELGEQGYGALGSKRAVVAQEARELLQEHLPRSAEDACRIEEEER